MNTPSRRRFALLAGILLLLVVALSGATADAQQASSPTGSGFDFGVHPYADPGAAPRGAFVFDVTAGQTLTDRVALVNPSAVPKDFYVYAADAYTTELGGGFGLHLRTDAPQDAGRWITLPVARYTVAPGTSALLPIQVAVPTDASPGDHSAGIVAEEIPPAAAPEKGAGVLPVHRVAARAYLRVRGAIHPSLTVEQLAVSRQVPTVPYLGGRGSATVTFTLRNTGNIRARLLDVDFQLNGALGHRLHRAKLVRATDAHPSSPLPDQILPGSEVRFTQRFEGLPIGGPVTAEVAVHAVDPVGSQPISTTRSVSFWVVPWPIVAVLVLLAGLWLGRRAWQRWHPAPVTPIGHPVGAGAGGGRR